jgi:hypothetical protein
VTQTSPNQPASAIVVGSKLRVTTVSASPSPPFKFNVNVQPVLEVADLQTHPQDTSALGTMNPRRCRMCRPGSTPARPTSSDGG